MQHARLGFQCRLPESNPSLSSVQKQRLGEILAKRSTVASWYLQRFAGAKRISMQRIPAEVKMSWFVMVIRLSDDYTQDHRDTMLKKLNASGIGCRDYFTPIHLQPFYQDMGFRQGQFPITEALSSRTLSLPFHNGLSEGDVDRVVREVKALL